ncbi:30S ribosomal protein S1 [Calycomorphotria hydatis]|uniref:Small ribosomal subunit protein bS1 n=1 Tax=Calycomorphotria hydatis TaxID=2528027 RepID=A0A517T9B7_9PLAN|nr:30S ribosomal protein S1 [Calycomorphotria hydatis]QDT64974.1 30S ribosomal protein S1 [Calycomorphotria hydatis]
MVDRNLFREFQIDDDDLVNILGDDFEVPDEVYVQETIDVNEIVKGKVLRINGDEVLVDIGYKSEGVVLLDEWEDEESQPEPGEEIEVLLEDIADEHGLILLSKRKADRIREWEEVTAKYGEGDVVTGKVLRKIKGGLLVDIGVNVFLPASQVDIRRPQDIGTWVDNDIECLILKVDEARRNIVVSRRKLIEERRQKMKDQLLTKIAEGEKVTGVVKNIADFGAFVDLGGIDGLLHITDMSWGRIGHPSEMVSIDEEIEVVILSIDHEHEKIALGLKQKFPSPWDNIETKYPANTKVKGEVVNVMPYGAFVKLEDGIEGLVHISEMSWTKRINHPTELVNIGDEVEVVVLGINNQKQEISLGMKQTQPNPWDEVIAKYPVGKKVTGVVRNLTNYGAFIELEEGVDGLLHVSDMSWTRKLSHANEMLKKGEDIECEILSVDEDRRRIALGLKQLDNDPWATDIPDRYQPGTIVTGTVTKITNFGVFVELEPELEGLLHVSELAEDKIDNAEELVKVDEQIEVKILRVDTEERKIGLSRRLDAPIEELQAADEAARQAPAGELKGGTGSSSGPLFSMGESPKEETESAVATEESPSAEEAEAAESDGDESSEED